MISKAKDKQVSSDVELAKQNSVAAASAVLNSVNSKTAEDDKISNKNPENANTELRKPAAAAAAAATVSEKKTVKVVKKVDDPIVANFTVEGWPESKSRIATDYVNYDEQTAILQPNQVFLSPDAGMFHNYYKFKLFCQFCKFRLRQPIGQRLSNVRTQQTKISMGPILFLYYEESLVSSNLNSKQLRLHGVRAAVSSSTCW